VIDAEAVAADAPPERGPIRRGLLAVAALLLGGLTSMELLALALGFVAVIGLLWTTHTVAPETLITDPRLRAAWVAAVLAVTRPLTWIPYIVLFLGLRRAGTWLASGSRRWRSNLLVNLLTVGFLAAAVGLAFLAVPGAARWTNSALGFATGTVGFAGLGTQAGRWGARRITLVAGAFVLVRPALPPLAMDFDLAARPALGFVEGRRGRFDRWLLWAALAVGAASAGLAAIRYL